MPSTPRLTAALPSPAISLRSPLQSPIPCRTSGCRNRSGKSQAKGAQVLMVTDYLQFIFQAIGNLLTENLGFFEAMGQNLFRTLATILVVWYGVKSALAAAGGKHSFQFDDFAS